MEPTKQGGADPSGLDAGPLSRQPPLPYLVEEATPPPLDPPQLLQPQQCDGTVGGTAGVPRVPASLTATATRLVLPPPPAT
jgi:hypothetical protein